jgi:hypothetical protein
MKFTTSVVAALSVVSLAFAAPTQLKKREETTLHFNKVSGGRFDVVVVRGNGPVYVGKIEHAPSLLYCFLLLNMSSKSQVTELSLALSRSKTPSAAPSVVPRGRSGRSKDPS